MDSEGSCDTEDWSNDAENSAAQHRNKYILKYMKYIWNTFDQINTAFFQTH